jgi:serine/threonine protein kinase
MCFLLTYSSVFLVDYFEDEDYYYIVMDLYGAGMDLFDYIELKEQGLTEEEVRFIFSQVVSAVGHLHNHGIVHRDIKDENVILDLKGGVRLIDFGGAAYLKGGKMFDTFVGTLDYAAPEILKGEPYAGPPQDIWACGILLYTLIYRENPFYNVDEIMERELRIPYTLSEGNVVHI